MYIKVYRVVHKDTNEGPYRGSISGHPRVRSYGGLTGKPDAHPTPWCENIKLDGSDVCGFRSIKQFKKWFLKEDRKHLVIKGFVLRKFKIEKKFVKYGDKQVVFRKSKARKIEEFNPLKV